MPDTLYRILTEGPATMQRSYEEKIRKLQLENAELRKEIQRLLPQKKSRWALCKKFLKNF